MELNFPDGWFDAEERDGFLISEEMKRAWDRYYEISIKNLVDAIHNSADKANLNAALRIITVYKGDIQSFSPLYPHISGIA